MERKFYLKRDNNYYPESFIGYETAKIQNVKILRKPRKWHLHVSVLIYCIVNVKEDNGERRATNHSSVSAVILQLFKSRLRK